jgi:hypothetical protein
MRARAAAAAADRDTLAEQIRAENGQLRAENKRLQAENEGLQARLQSLVQMNRDLRDQAMSAQAEIARIRRQGVETVSALARNDARLRRRASPFLERGRANAADANRNDEEDLPKFVELLLVDAENTKSAAVKMNIGQDRAKRLRALAIKRGMLSARRRRV